MPEAEFARAKINLTLEVLGRRPDGYHELRSLVVFAKDAGDRLTRAEGRFAATEVTGPFAGALEGANLVDKAVAALASLSPGLEAGQLVLEKALPVGSGIGGGSADAAAALRLLQRQAGASDGDLHAIAMRLGADAPVCLRSRAAIMSGVGEEIEDVTLPGDLFAVLANPMVAVPSNKTAQVFTQLAAPTLAGARSKEDAPVFSDTGEVIAYAARRGNDLEGAARALFPAVGDVLDELRALRGAHLAQLSGAGPTCFALFEDEADAWSGARDLERRRPDWWVKPTRLV